MKKPFFLFFLLFNCALLANEPPFNLNSENLTLLALKSSPKTDFDKYVLNLIKTQHSDEYYPIRKDTVKRAALIKKYADKIKSSASKFTEKTQFKWTHKVSFEEFKADQSLLTIKNFLFGSIKAIPTNSTLEEGLPSNFMLLIANIELINDIPVDSAKFQSVIDDRKNERNKQLFLEMTLVLPKFHNSDNFQTVIKELKVYDSQKKKVLLATRKETAKTKDLIENWLLSDGYTNKLIGIHAFSFLGYRLQDILRNISNMKEYCHKATKLGKHQVVVCDRPYRENALIVITYIGGVVAKVDLLAKSALSQKEKKNIAQTVMIKLGQTKAIFNEKKVQWSKYNTDFEFYSDAFFGQKSATSKYKYSFVSNDQQKNSDYTLIASMMSQETKKLIEDNQ